MQKMGFNYNNILFLHQNLLQIISKTMHSKKIGNLLPGLILKHFPQKLLSNHIRCIIGYGSGVFPQTNSTTASNAIDLIFLAENIQIFHSQLSKIRPSDYTGLSRYLGPSYLKFLNDKVFPAHFNHVLVQGRKIKYAVVSVPTFINDLSKWDLLTFAGRMHKPVLFNIMQSSQSADLLVNIQKNYRFALNVAILSMIGKVKNDQSIPIQRLYQQISNISYAGDIRHSMGVQNVNKVSNIVKNNIGGFNEIYEPLIRNLKQNLAPNTIDHEQGTNKIKIRYTPELIHRIVEKQFDNIPLILSQHLQNVYDDPNNKNYKSLTQKILMHGVSLAPKQIKKKLGNINQKSSMKMAMQNFLSASFSDNVKYILAKINKKNIK